MAQPGRIVSKRPEPNNVTDPAEAAEEEIEAEIEEGLEAKAGRGPAVAGTAEPGSPPSTIEFLSE